MMSSTLQVIERLETVCQRQRGLIEKMLLRLHENGDIAFDNEAASTDCLYHSVLGGGNDIPFLREEG